jgi:phage portal protein BeeE
MSSPETTPAEVGTPKATWVPSRKWGVLQIASAVGLATMYITSGSWDQEESIALVTWLGAAASTYLIPNAEAK